MSEASPTIWSDPDGFANWAEQMTLRAESVAVAAETGQAFDGEFASLSETCRGCHEGYRVKK